ncbi:alkylhydroperoxidase domain protein [Psychromarinibacter sp. S121]|uniref:alkylhydroperoxidase domain protein n=1 Tax=Psychromarinibacter sp. S121 TaxID=3415127 RepID=UPI003C7D06A9
MTETVLTHENPDEPNVFTQDMLGWEPWLPPMDEADLTERHWTALVQKGRSKMPYFMLLARDPDILEYRTRTDMDIFYNPDAGLPRADREMAAAATSRYNGCIYCASVHSRFATQHSKRKDEVQKLLDEGVSARIDPRWDAITDAAVALTSIPMTFGPDHIEALRATGMDDQAIADAIYAISFFNWANRLMLSLGPTTPGEAK